jgi:hypothetical protein
MLYPSIHKSKSYKKIHPNLVGSENIFRVTIF